VKVLVTGATGFVGSHVVDVLLEKGYDVDYIARATSNLRWLDGKKARRVDGSLSDLPSLRRALEDCDAVIHVAGLTAARSEAEFFRGNRDATQTLIDAVRTYRPGLSRFVHISSGAACGPAPDADHPVTEATLCKPITTYGRSKLAAEDVVTRAAADVPTTIIRPPAVYGPRDSAILTFFQAVQRGLAPVIGFDEKLVSLIHGLDLARGIVDAMGHPVAVGKTYFITSEKFYTWPQIINLTAAIMGKRRVLQLRLPHFVVRSLAGIVGGIGKLSKKPPVLDYEKGIDITQPYWIFSSEKARRELGYRESFDLDDGIRNTVEWYRANGWL
jgi:dihydroflavonol-4-reductase